jgi:hypothetical protein
MASSEPESPVMTSTLMQAICDPDNIASAVPALVRNKGAPGVDGITVRLLPGVLQARWPEIENQLLQRRYQPQPVRRVQIPKPAGGTRDLGIATAIDRVIQQAVLQQRQPLWDPTFSEQSYGFRPGRSAHQAVAQAQATVAEGYRIVVDLDLAKFFRPGQPRPTDGRGGRPRVRPAGAPADPQLADRRRAAWRAPRGKPRAQGSPHFGLGTDEEKESGRWCGVYEKTRTGALDV